jgi:putative transcriptional regulator
MSKQTISRLTEAMLETADGMRRIGVMDQATHQQITIRHLGAQSVYTSEPITGEEIRILRERANLSQAAFARYLNLTSGYISQLERGSKHPTGAVLTLLNVIRRKGLEVIL